MNLANSQIDFLTYILTFNNSSIWQCWHKLPARYIPKTPSAATDKKRCTSSCCQNQTEFDVILRRPTKTFYFQIFIYLLYITHNKSVFTGGTKRYSYVSYISQWVYLPTDKINQSLLQFCNSQIKYFKMETFFTYRYDLSPIIYVAERIKSALYVIWNLLSDEINYDITTSRIKSLLNHNCLFIKLTTFKKIKVLGSCNT